MFNQIFLLGIYVDTEARCQSFHTCRGLEQGKITFLCPNGTIFSQMLFTCQWWFEVNCEDMVSFLQIDHSEY
ncbi:UNVERIFIED_CONTAM: hypothetical protein GTU68_049807 [Idotea baltica]|nr:hypothetical protein [Idotea baltica]